MSKIDYQALREAAEKATPGRVGDRIDGSGSIKYECHGYDGSLVLRTDHKNMEYGFIGDNSNADELFFRLCVPDVILALLDELEAADNNLIDSECHVAELEEALRDKQALLEASERRIAELESLMEPKLPQPAVVDNDKFRADFERWMVEDEKCIVGSSDPYPAGIESRNWRAWNACRAAVLQFSEPVTDNTNRQFESLSRGDK